MDVFLKYLARDLEKSRLASHVTDMEGFLSIRDGVLFVDLMLLDEDYLERFVSHRPRQYAQDFINFSIRAMAFQKGANVFRFAFLEKGTLWLEHNVNEFRAYLVSMISERFPELRPTLSQQNEIDLEARNINAQNKYDFYTMFVPMFREVSKRADSIATWFNVKDEKGRIAHRFIYG